ncbi:hypothetical protein [Methanosarcina sp.]|uniref:hypothetical protein n=1 Tax=Methanosarcina sp. TaxID=2213 RepID=UPI003BB7FBFB
MTSNSTLSFFIFIIFLTSFVSPVSANPIDTSIEVVSRGIGNFVEYQAAKNLEDSYGVTFGNTTKSESLPPSHKLVVMIAAANQNPYKTKVVRDQLASDMVWFSIAVFFISLITFGLTLLQKYAPGFVSSLDNRFIGHDEIHDYTVWLEALGTVVILAIVVLPSIEEILELEQSFSDGLTLNALEFLKLTPAAPRIFYWESQAYSFCASFFLWRIEYINWFAGNALKIIILYSVALFYSRYLAGLLTAWFLSVVFMRPLILWYSNIAIKDIAAAYPQTDSMYGDLAGLIDINGIINQDMTFVIFASALTCIIGILWPVFMMILKIIFDYLLSCLYKFLLISRTLRRI